MLTLRHSLHLKTFEKASVTNGYVVPENQGSSNKTPRNTT